MIASVKMDSKNRHLLFAARLSLGAAALFAAILAWGSGVGIATVCGPGACASALQSPYAHIAGVPFALLGLIVYVVAFVAAGAIASGRDNYLVFAGKICCALILVFALWLTALQFVIIGGYCSGCTITHLFGVGGAATVLLASRRGGEHFAAFEIALTGGLASLVMLLQAIVGGGGVATPPAEFAGVGNSSRQMEAAREADVVLHDGLIQGYLDDFPLMGQPAAEHKIYALVDPTDARCRKTEPMLASIQQGFGDDLAIVVVPGAPDAESAAVHRTLLAIWHSNRAAHGVLCRDLAGGMLEAKRTTVELRAAEVIGADALRASYIENAVAIRRAMDFGRDLLVANASELGRKTVPQMLVGKRVIPGRHPDPDYYVAIISEEFGIQPEGTVHASTGPALEFVGGDVQHIGTIPPGEVNEVEVMVRNVGGEDLEIDWVSLTPGCGVVSIPRSAIGAGEGGRISLRF